MTLKKVNMSKCWFVKQNNSNIFVDFAFIAALEFFGEGNIIFFQNYLVVCRPSPDRVGQFDFTHPDPQFLLLEIGAGVAAFQPGSFR